MNEHYDYDVIIIGAGIGGLVCGCYLGKAGLKTLIVEKNLKAGGYCTSFNRNGYQFDACVHSLGSMGENGNFRKIINELGIDVDIKRYLPSDIIITPDFKISFGDTLDKSIRNFQKCFAEERDNIEKFFNAVVEMDKSEYINLRNKTFSQVIDIYFKDAKLKSVLSFPILGNMGLPPSRVAAFSAFKLYKEFMLDGGYYPVNGMDYLVKSFLNKFLSYGGKIIASCEVKKIVLKNDLAKGVALADNSIITSRYLVSGCDFRHTIFNLIGKENMATHNLNIISELQNTLSSFIIYLGAKNEDSVLLNEGLSEGANVWVLPSYNIDKLYNNALDRQISNVSEFMLHVFPKRKTMSVFVNCDSKNRKFWETHKIKFAEEMLKKVTAQFPKINSSFKLIESSSPYTLYEHTLNYKGASYGWDAIPEQLGISLRSLLPVKNMNIVGHWTTLAAGVNGVAYIGSKVADEVIYQFNHKSKK